MEVGGVRFARNGYLEAADAVRSLRRNGRRVFLTSQRAAAGLAGALGVDRYGDGMNDDEKVRILHDLRQQGFAAAYVGDGLAHAPAAREADLSISLGGGDAAGDVGSEREPSDIVLMSPSISSLPALCALARDGARRRERARYAVMLPNLLCVAGAFVFGFTPMAAVFLSNFGTSVAYNGAKRALREAEPMRLDDGWYADDERTRPQRAEIRAGG
jgi:Cu2+-exporting ATPase